MSDRARVVEEVLAVIAADVGYHVGVLLDDGWSPGDAVAEALRYWTTRVADTLGSAASDAVVRSC